VTLQTGPGIANLSQVPADSGVHYLILSSNAAARLNSQYDPNKPGTEQRLYGPVTQRVVHGKKPVTYH